MKDFLSLFSIDKFGRVSDVKKSLFYIGKFGRASLNIQIMRVKDTDLHGLMCYRYT